MTSPSLPDSGTPLVAGSSMMCSRQEMYRPSALRARVGREATGPARSATRSVDEGSSLTAPQADRTIMRPRAAPLIYDGSGLSG